MIAAEGTQSMTLPVVVGSSCSRRSLVRTQNLRSVGRSGVSSTAAETGASAGAATGCVMKESIAGRQKAYVPWAVQAQR